MAKIILNPRIRNNIRYIDFNRYAHAPPERQAELMEWYENGELLILTNYEFEGGRDVLSAITFPNEKRYKKIMLHGSEIDHGEPPREREWTMIKEELLGGDPVKIEAFETAVFAANHELVGIVDAVFPRYIYTKRLCIYNLSEMLAHNLHFDSPQHADSSTQLRAFVNLDNFPRIWHVSESLEDIARRYYGKARTRKTIGAHPREFTRSLTHAAFGDRYDSGTHNQPKHSIAFQPGEVWFLNPNMTAHEVVYGRRLLDAVFLFDQTQLQDKSRYFPAIVESLHSKHLGKVSYALHRVFNHLTHALPARLARKPARGTPR